MSELSIAAENLCRYYELGNGAGLKRAVDNVSFKLSEGERIGFIGANGAGKTTLLQMLSSISEPTSGRLEVKGNVTAIFTLGMGLRDDLPGLENIYVEGELQGRTRQETERVVDEIVEFADLGDFIDRPVRTYSTGMKARLAFSTIVHIDPEILIIDEALSVGDAQFAKKATRKMKELAERGKILVVVSHSMRAIESMCNRCIWMEGGRIKLDGSPAAVTKAYLDQIRSANETALFERFRRDLHNDSLAKGWQVKSLQVHGESGEAPVTTLITGERSRLSASIAGQAGARFDMKLHIRRLDGLIVQEVHSSDSKTEFSVPADSEARVSIGFGALPLNSGVYLAALETSFGSMVTARRSTLFEVVNPNPHLGGKPVIVYPSTVNATRLTS